ncbi:hypothetical protein B296_00024151 [Ensete ventricosum]|uniref:Uncharacterized protein n=1 Tax=Ensete ventricosum TaxID=4639 RepID=A0A426XI86_ENSVE|nr:hypothetical protein B296_00024151 [Ensete ventricosum]
MVNRARWGKLDFCSKQLQVDCKRKLARKLLEPLMRSATANKTSMKLGILRKRRRHHLEQSSQEEAESQIERIESLVDQLTEDTKDSVRHLHEVVAKLMTNERSRSEERASRFGIQRNSQPLRERHHEDKQAKKNVGEGELLTRRIRYSCKSLYTDDGVFVAILSKCICGSRTRHKLFSKTEESKGVGGLQNFQREECKEESCSNRTDIQEG